jgi:two-component system sensor kinase FixL
MRSAERKGSALLGRGAPLEAYGYRESLYGQSNPSAGAARSDFGSETATVGAEMIPVAQSAIWFILLLEVAQAALVVFLFGRARRRSRSEHESALSAERLSLISSMSSFGFWSWDATNDVAWVSKHSRTILGLSEDTPLSGQSLLAAIHPEDRPSVLQAINSTPRPNTIEMEMRVAGPRGEIRWITVKASAFVGPKGVLSRVAGYIVDDSQRKRTAQDLLKLQEKLTHLSRVALLGELSGALAHELQQPLTAILCNAHSAQLLTKSASFNMEELREILQEIVNDDKNAGQIIQRLRALLIRGETQFDHLAIRDLVGDVLTLARGTLRERNVQVNTRIAEGIPWVKGDRVELQQVLLNLVLNACESMSSNPARDRRVEIVVDFEGDASAVLISVLDCGSGIAVEQLERVFEPFFSTKAGGLGLGLAISHSIIEAHGGRLWATNRSDRGAAFHFTLPIMTGTQNHERYSANSVYS